MKTNIFNPRRQSSPELKKPLLRPKNSKPFETGSVNLVVKASDTQVASSAQLAQLQMSPHLTVQDRAKGIANQTDVSNYLTKNSLDKHLFIDSLTWLLSQCGGSKLPEIKNNEFHFLGYCYKKKNPGFFGDSITKEGLFLQGELVRGKRLFANGSSENGTFRYIEALRKTCLVEGTKESYNKESSNNESSNNVIQEGTWVYVPELSDMYIFEGIKEPPLDRSFSLIKTLKKDKLTDEEIMMLKQLSVLLPKIANNSLLHLAAKHGHITIVKELLYNGADVNAKNESGNTPLHDAAREGHTEIVKELLKAEADVTAKTNSGHTPLQIAGYRGHKDKDIEILLRKAEAHEAEATK